MIKLLSRDSLLALSQTTNILFHLKQHNKAAQVITRKTKGDLNLNDPLYAMPEKGSTQAKAIFIKELEDGLLRNEGDVAVHSLKDLPTELPSNLELSHVCLEEDDRDLIISKSSLDLDNLDNLKVGTSSLRRIEQLREYLPKAVFKNLRGNVITRLEKLIATEDYDIIVLAAAGLKRLLLTKQQMEKPDFVALLSDEIKATMERDLDRLDKISNAGLSFYLLDSLCCLPAVSQGKLGLEIKKTNKHLKEELDQAFASDQDKIQEANTLRELLNVAEAGCHAAFGAKITEDRLDIYYKSEERTFRGYRSLCHGLDPIVKELKNDALTILWTGADSEQFPVKQGKLLNLPLFQTKFANPPLPTATKNLVIASKRILDFYDKCPVSADKLFAPGPITAQTIKENWGLSAEYPKTGLGIDYLSRENLLSLTKDVLVLGSKESDANHAAHFIKVYDNQIIQNITKPQMEPNRMVILALASPIAVQSAYENQLLDDYFLAVYGEKAKQLLESYGKKAYIYSDRGSLQEFMQTITFSSLPKPLQWVQCDWESL